MEDPTPVPQEAYGNLSSFAASFRASAFILCASQAGYNIWPSTSIWRLSRRVGDNYISPIPLAGIDVASIACTSCDTQRTMRIQAHVGTKAFGSTFRQGSRRALDVSSRELYYDFSTEGI
jgi:hypothetical protein